MCIRDSPSPARVVAILGAAIPRWTLRRPSSSGARYVSGKTREEVRRKLAKAMADRDGGLVFNAGALTVGEYMDRWLKDVKDTVRQSTHERYEYAINPHITPALGRIKLKDLTPAQVRWF